MTGHRILEYLGLRHEPGTTRTGAERALSWVMVAAVVVALFVTRDLAFWPQVAILVGVALVAGLAVGVVLTRATARRERSPDV
ncbi:hypothetical protein [Aeromicrobium endophyticum]|uniref:DUF202 domain-containing protein n=1 Tax=Aeromicrobium endophyticum TaxID=2292704 RepID=A0A371NZ02_9ACTN|nr:hypothetical protein [Aeromicrobium endophyticum]REK68913.1 hypothetical protein DX116_18810 [Aeromicrobium endophyticum]